MKRALLVVLAVGMIAVGALHFVKPEPFVRIVPAVLPGPLVLVYASGAFEIAGGIGLLVESTRRAAAFGLIALYIAVFPANIKMAFEGIPFGDGAMHPLLPWLRLPVQLVFVAWAYLFTQRTRSRASRGAADMA